MDYQGPLGIYANLYTALGFTPGASLIITNKGQHVVFIVQGAVQPSAGGFPLHSGETCIVQGHDDQEVWALASISDLYVQALVNTVMPFQAVDLPHYLYTSDMERYRRLRVDVAQTGFFEGREFRTYYEYNIPAGTSVWIKVVIPVDTILHDFNISQDAGSLRVRPYAGGTDTPPGSFSTALPVLPKNNMAERPSPYYVAQVQVFTGAGASITGGTQIDVIRIVASNATAQQATVGRSISDERGVAAGTYYYRLENIGSSAATGVLSGWWEERPLPNF